MRALRIALVGAVISAGCASDSIESSATKALLVIYADQPPTGAQVSINGQLRGTLTASYSNGSPGCFGPDGASDPVGTVMVPMFLGETYAIDVQYTNGTSDHLDLAATQDVIDSFCYGIGTHPN